MKETILAKLESSRKELLDLGMRNSLLNYKLPSNRGLHIVQEKSLAVFDILVSQTKAMSFIGRPSKEGNPIEIEFVELSEPELEESYGDTKLQTNESEITLARRLLNTYYSARTSIEEQGVNILYISLGMLHWYESESSQEERQAPLLLIPVSLERSSARERFRVKYTLEEIGANISLQAKMKMEFEITIPDLPEIDDFDVTEYIGAIAGSIEKMPRWKVETDAIELGFFSFGKFMIYNDLDNNKWPEHKKPVEHTLIQNIFEYGFSETDSSLPDDAFIDRDTTAHELYQIVDADSSQILSMLDVRDGKNLVIQGPPGTGKSQTITNLIADAIGRGKKVLFVAEKMAALEVVKRRLDLVGLGEACLELHSQKANKKELHQELMRVLELGRPNLERLQDEVALLTNVKSELNAYCEAINSQVGKSGLTAHMIIGRLLQIRETAADTILPKFRPDDFSDWDMEQMRRVEAFAERIQARLQQLGVPNKLLFWGSNMLVVMPAEMETISELLKECLGSIESLNSSIESAANRLGYATPVNIDGMNKLVTIARIASSQPDTRGINVITDRWLLNKLDIDELLAAGKSLYALQETYAEIFVPGAWDQNVFELRQHLIAHGNKWYKFAIGAYNKSKSTLAGLCKTTLPKENSAKLKYVDDILEAKRLSSIMKEHESLAVELFGNRWQRIKSSWSILESAKNYLLNVHQSILENVCPKEILDYLIRDENPSFAKEYDQQLSHQLVTYHQHLKNLVHKLSFDESRRFTGKGIANQPFSSQRELLSQWHSRQEEIHQVTTWNTLVESAEEERFGFLTNLSQSWPEAKNLLKITIQKNWFDYLLEVALATQAPLRRFQRDSHEEVVRQFRRLDMLNLQHNRGRAAFMHWQGVPRTEAGGQVNILKKEFNKKARLKPIRKVIEEAGLAVQAIKPVFMMSPLSIANFLPPGSVEFDLVIFDEASQVRPVDALGAILRAKQLVVVGDTKQLPPTSFFDSLTKESDDEDNVTADMQSILGMCQSQGLIAKMLRWHYRSRHESLITLSNHEFYENKLVIFPSPGSKYRMGLMLHHSPDTFYDRGKTRTNPKEAEIVVDAVIEHAKNNPKQTLGVVAFSSAQRQAIQDALELRRRRFPETEVYFKSHSHEPFFIKNLENVQGDERDVIFISIGYGRSQEGYVTMSFGPLNNEGGERRLNVLITRAKLRCDIFTNITSEDIDLSRTKSYGIRTLKNFLYFAQHGKLNNTAETSLPADSPFEENVYDKLVRLGYVVRRQIGSQGFFIDMAVVDAQSPGRYVIGIECDGAAYHSARSARDRDRLRQQVLENIGWKIHRIWSTDWFRNPDKELKRLVEAIEKAKELLLVDDDEYEKQVAAQEISMELIREQNEKIEDKISEYKIAVLSFPITQDIHLYPVGKLSYWIEEIVSVESPVHFDEMARRIVEAGNFTKVGSRIREALMRASQNSESTSKIKIKGEFLWHSTMDTPVVRIRSNMPSSSRKIKFISPEEITLAIVGIVQDAIAILPGDAAVLTGKVFGFFRVTEEMKSEILEVIHQAVNNNVIKLDGDLLKMP